MQESIEIMTCTCGDHVYTPVYNSVDGKVLYIAIKINTPSKLKNELAKCFDFLSNDCKISYRMVTADFEDPDNAFILLDNLAKNESIKVCDVIDIGVFL